MKISLTPFLCLKTWASMPTGSQEGAEYQPFEVLNNTARQARAKAPGIRCQRQAAARRQAAVERCAIILASSMSSILLSMTQRTHKA